ncbi:MAG: type IV pilus assembly protein PilM [Planctomycetia bacterium]|nr:type IV pilus assembly protein PilM [Planctomycetia bacterium]
MARSDAVWGIDVGQCALKALRCRPGADAASVVADAFDYIEYPKILSQPEADPAALVQEALKQFLSRNSVRGDRVAISVPGQSGLARFIKLPPVESRKIPDIVKYEAKQQIPFSLEDVVWDYQKMVGGSEEEGFALETEVGLFAMKRDQVFRALRPFTDAAIEVDVVQLTPLALYNYVAFDQMQDLPAPADYDPDNPPPSIVVLSLGTDSTDLVVTNGYRVWQRSIPIGGNHFTKALTKELKLTFATAEHLKRNAAKAEDPKALFQAMRPVFNDLLTEVQRSIGYFTNLDRRAKIGRVLALGNAMKLPGLQRYLAQNLGIDFNRVESFRGLSGAAVVDVPAFKENVLSFGVSYGLSLQGLKAGKIKTNLLPRELLKDRMIREKKPWAVGAAAALLLGCTVSYLGYWRAWRSVAQENYFAPVLVTAEGTVKTAKGYQSSFDSAKSTYTKTGGVIQTLSPSNERRTRWLKVWKAINLCVPRDEGEPPESIPQRKQIHIMSIQAQHVDDLGVWYGGVRDFDKPDPKLSTDGGAAPPVAEASLGPSGAGWVIELTGYHFHNTQGDPNHGRHYVRSTLIKNLKAGKVAIPKEDQEENGPTEIDFKKMGLGYPVLVVGHDRDPAWEFQIEEPSDEPGQKKMKEAPKFDFVLQLCWQDEPPAEPTPQPGEAPAGETAAAPAEGAGETPTAPTETPAASTETPAEPATEPSGEGTGTPAPAAPTPPAQPDGGETPPGENPTPPGDNPAPAPSTPPANP